MGVRIIENAGRPIRVFPRKIVGDSRGDWSPKPPSNEPPVAVSVPEEPKPEIVEEL